jgi:hypothetical protein
MGETMSGSHPERPNQASRDRKRPILAGLVIAALAATALPAAAFDNFRNSFLFAAANGQTQTCRRASQSDNFDISNSSGVSSLYRVDRATGAATLIGVIEDPNLSGVTVAAGLDPNAVPITRRSILQLPLSPTERIIDVCGLAVGDGRLMGTATLEETGIHVLIEIDPNTAQAKLIGSLNADTGLQGVNWSELPDATLCHPMDLTYDPVRSKFQTVLSCRFIFDPVVANRARSDVLRTMLAYVDPEANPKVGLARTLSTIDSITLVENLSAYDRRVNPMMTWFYLDSGAAPAEILQNRLTIAHRPSNGKRIGVNNRRIFYYLRNGGIDVSRQYGLAGQALEDFLDVEGANVSYWDHYRRLEPIPSMVLLDQTTAMDYDASDPAEHLYRSYIDEATLESMLEVLDPDTALANPGFTPVAINNVHTGLNVAGVQAIAFGDYPDQFDRTARFGGPDFDYLTPCSVSPRNESVCNVATTSPLGSSLNYLESTGQLSWTTYRGFRLEHSDLGTPTSWNPNTRYALCIYAREGLPGTRRSIISGRQASDPQQWENWWWGFRYNDSAGPLSILLQLSSLGYTQVAVAAANIEFPALPLGDTGIVLQLQSNDGQCFSSHFRGGSLIVNSPSSVGASSY